MEFTTFDPQILIRVLFWCNLTSMVLVYIYRFTSMPFASEKKLTRYVLLAKSCFALSFLLSLFKSRLPEIIGSNISHSLIILGVLSEAYSLLMLIQKNTYRNTRIIQGIALAALLILNESRFIWPERVIFTAIGPFSIFAILIIPSCKLMYSRRSTTFKRFVGMFYVLFSTLLLPKGIAVLMNPARVDDPSPYVQTLNYTALMLLVVFSLSAFLLLMKEETDAQMCMLAQTDSLTRLNNRQHFFALVQPAFQRHKREGILCSVLFLDIDHFKRVNDTYGHGFGDEVISTVGAIMKTAVRGYDICCRYGGEEFVVFVDSPDPDTGCMTAERIRATVEKQKFAKQPEFKCTVSVGVATYVPSSRDTVDTFIGIADEALYDAKKSGRNMVIERTACEKSHSRRHSSRLFSGGRAS